MAEPRGETPRQKMALDLARDRLAALDAPLVAARAGVHYAALEDGHGQWTVRFLGRVYTVSFPEGDIRTRETGRPPHHAASLILLHYLAQSDGTPPAGEWVAFRELPDGMTYHAAFVSRVEPPLLGVFGARPEALIASGRALGGFTLAVGDAAICVDALPRLRMACVVYRGDDEFPPAANILYDAAAGHHLPIEDLAVLGGLFAGALCQAASRPL